MVCLTQFKYNVSNNKLQFQPIFIRRTSDQVKSSGRAIKLGLEARPQRWQSTLLKKDVPKSFWPNR